MLDMRRTALVKREAARHERDREVEAQFEAMDAHRRGLEHNRRAAETQKREDHMQHHKDRDNFYRSRVCLRERTSIISNPPSLFSSLGNVIFVCRVWCNVCILL